jgi:hypothetical protein
MLNDPVKTQSALKDGIGPPRDLEQGTYTVVKQLGIGGFSKTYSVCSR